MATDLTAPAVAEAEPTAPVQRRRRRGLAIAVGGAAIAAVVSVAAVSSGGAPVEHRVAVEGAAPAFDLPRVGAPDERVTLADFAGRPLVVNFWASWCVPCRKEMPALEAAAERLAGRVGFVGINHQDGDAAAADFEDDVGVTYPSGYDPDGAVARAYGVLGLPTTVLVDASGRIVARRLGEVSDDELARLITDAFGIPAGRATP